MAQAQAVQPLLKTKSIALEVNEFVGKLSCIQMWHSKKHCNTHQLGKADEVVANGNCPHAAPNSLSCSPANCMWLYSWLLLLPGDGSRPCQAHLRTLGSALRYCIGLRSNDRTILALNHRSVHRLLAALQEMIASSCPHSPCHFPSASL